jgi:hypothetical protein
MVLFFRHLVPVKTLVSCQSPDIVLGGSLQNCHRLLSVNLSGVVMLPIIEAYVELRVQN